MTEMQKKQLEEMHSAGISFRKISKKLGVSMPEIQMYCAEKYGWLEQLDKANIHKRLKVGISCRR